MIGGIHGPKGVSDYEVQTATGKDWSEWLDLLDAWGGEKASFVPITRYLMRQFGLSYYWAQAVAVHYVWKRLYLKGPSYLTT